MTDLTESTKVTEEEINLNPRLKAINEAITNLINLCNVKPMASVILSVCVPNDLDDPDTENDRSIVSIYSGDTVSHINQLDLFTEHESQFMHDLMIFLDIRVKRQMEAYGTTGNTLADQMLAKINPVGNETIN